MYLVTVLIVRAMKLKQEGKTLGSLIADLKEPVESREIRLNITADDFRDAGKVVIQRVLDYANAAENWHMRRITARACAFPSTLTAAWTTAGSCSACPCMTPVLPLNVESDVPGGVQQMLGSLLKVLNDAEGIDLTPLKKAVEEA